MAMAALLSSASLTSNACRGTRGGIHHKGESLNLNKYSSVLIAPEIPGSTRHGSCGRGGVASSCARAGVQGAVAFARNVEFEWRSSRLIRFQHSLVFPSNGPARRQFVLRIVAEKPDFTKVAGNLYRLGKEGLDAGTKFVPESVPRPLAQAGVVVGSLVVGSFLLSSLLSTVTFIVAIGALSYAAYVYLTKVERSGSGDKPAQGTDEAIEEARKIMEKYK